MISFLTPEFVEFIPSVLDEGKLYISETYATASHNCCCGCGQRVVTPLNPTGWRLTVRQGLVSLYPSIGNWAFPCQSHYWIEQNKIRWSYQMTDEEIDRGRRYDAHLKELHFGEKEAEAPLHIAPLAPSYNSDPPAPKEGVLGRLWRWICGR